MRYTSRKRYSWSHNLAYAVGLLSSDGNLSCDNRHVGLVSKDMEQIENFKDCLGLNSNLRQKKSNLTDNLYYEIQFSDVALYDFLLDVGLSPRKSLVLGELKIPDQYFFAFLRGYLDGDGCCYGYFDKRWRNSYMIYIQFTSGSINHLKWINSKIQKFLGFSGKIKSQTRAYNLVFAKKSSLSLS